MDAFKDILNKVIAFVRRYVSLVIPGVIVLVALLLIIPTKLVGREIDKKMAASQSARRKISNYAKSAPSSKQAEVEKAFQDAYETDGKTVSDMIINSTRRELINYSVFPKPEDGSRQIFDVFAKDYRKEIEGLLEKMVAIEAPGDDEIDKATGVSTTASRSSRPSRSGGSGGYGGFGEGMMEGGEASQSRPTARRSRSTNKKDDDSYKIIVDGLCVGRSQEGAVYATPDVFTWYDFWDHYVYENHEQSIDDCWYSQITFWVYSDIVDTIIAMNSNSSSTVTSPVKRLMAVSFSSQVSGGTSSSRSRTAIRSSRGASSQSADIPVYLAGEEVAPLGVESLTGRVSDDNVDVIHFSFGVLVSSKHIPSFIRELSSQKKHLFGTDWKARGDNEYVHNQISVLKYDMKPVMRDDADHELYRYGDSAVVRLDLVCEYVFVKEGYSDIIPETIAEIIEKADSEPSGNSGYGEGGYGF